MAKGFSAYANPPRRLWECRGPEEKIHVLVADIPARVKKRLPWGEKGTKRASSTYAFPWIKNQQMLIGTRVGCCTPSMHIYL